MSSSSKPAYSDLGSADMADPELPAPPMPERQSAPCSEDVCITCSDTAVAVEVVRLLDDDLAIVATGSGQEEVSVALVTANVGDTILVHAREAIGVVAK